MSLPKIGFGLLRNDTSHVTLALLRFQSLLLFVILSILRFLTFSDISKFLNCLKMRQTHFRKYLKFFRKFFLKIFHVAKGEFSAWVTAKKLTSLNTLIRMKNFLKVKFSCSLTCLPRLYGIIYTQGRVSAWEFLAIKIGCSQLLG